MVMSIRAGIVCSSARTGGGGVRGALTTALESGPLTPIAEISAIVASTTAMPTTDQASREGAATGGGGRVDGARAASGTPARNTGGACSGTTTSSSGRVASIRPSESHDLFEPVAVKLAMCARLTGQR
jgi:hypothetical protein